MRNLILTFFLLISNITFSQELFINAEPASLIPKGSKVLSLVNSNIFLNGVDGLDNSLSTATLLVPSLSYGISKRLMVRFCLQLSNNPFVDYYPNWHFNGFKFYSKQRILSSDRPKYHTRLSSFIKGSYHNDKFMKNDLDIDIQDSGFQFGLIGTQLVNKFAISITSGLGFYTKEDLNLFMNSVSLGYLVLPRKYKSYKQTNFNVYLEYETNTILNNSFSDRYNKFSSTIAPGIQFILFSRSRLDFSYKIRKNNSPDEFLVKLTYIIY